MTFETDSKSNKTPATNLDTTLDLSATDGNGHALTGTGNPAAGWETENNSTFHSQPTCIIGKAILYSRWRWIIKET